VKEAWKQSITDAKIKGIDDIIETEIDNNYSKSEINVSDNGKITKD
jgi:hypothetical protein